MRQDAINKAVYWLLLSCGCLETSIPATAQSDLLRSQQVWPELDISSKVGERVALTGVLPGRFSTNRGWKQTWEIGMLAPPIAGNWDCDGASLRQEAWMHFRVIAPRKSPEYLGQAITLDLVVPGFELMLLQHVLHELRHDIAELTVVGRHHLDHPLNHLRRVQAAFGGTQ